MGLVTLAQYMGLATLAQWFNSISGLHGPGSRAISLFISGAGYPCSIFGAGYPCLNFAFHFKIYLLPSSLKHLTNTNIQKPSLDKHLQLLLKKWVLILIDCSSFIWNWKHNPPHSRLPNITTSLIELNIHHDWFAKPCCFLAQSSEPLPCINTFS